MSGNPNKRVVTAANGPKPNPMMSNVIVSGDKVYLAGILGTDESGGLVAGGAKAETAQALQNVSARLELAGLDLSDVISVTIYLTDYAVNLPLLNEVYLPTFSQHGPAPVRAAVGVAALPFNAAAEFSVIAATRA
ncbi:uncharacterized protein EHS24_001547 [Apiotrichum porosum]|uniref:Uncharacterized protein n=1 Tax=Apiotrichum porosum TaxID=105984 RepID=A0A427XKT4_9TREE|nr:uncharacterized protein EHS24_001547 [Apiotrichum porosum]RSH79495.1 hypothetical protein EHS24_001547 [Apiotrichum porosum]